MKTKLASIKSLGGFLRLGAAAGAVLLSCGAPLHARAAAFDSPVGDWDVVMNARHQGLAVITFADDGTFSMSSILVPKPPTPPSSGVTDRGLADDSRNDSGNTNVIILPPHTNLFGAFFIPQPDTVNPDGSVNHVGVDSGHWGFDAKGRLVGFYTDVSGYDVCVTNLVLVNNPITGGVDTNIVIECNRLTNAISFVGTVSPGKRLTMVSSTPDGKSVYTGVPITTVNLPDLSGNWTGVKTDDHLIYNEFFTLLRNSPDANTYTVDGGGPGYFYGGTALLSKSGKFAFTLSINPGTDPTKVHIRAVTGTLNKSNLSFRTMGFDEVSGDPANHILFTGVRTSVP